MSQFEPLANHLWQSTLFAAAAAILTLLLRRNRAQTRYALWLAASLKFLVPFSLLIDFGSQFQFRSAPPPIAQAIQQAGETFVAPLVFAPSSPSIAAPVTNWLPIILCTVWAAGTATLLFSWWRRDRAIRTALRSSTPVPLLLPIPARTSAAFAEPGVFGIRRPVLLLPAGIADHLTPPQFAAILAHELCHVRRRDNLATTIHMAVEAIFWFHPLVWWLGARLLDERERACDEEVLRCSDPEAYAEGILKVCELYLESPLPCVSGITGANLKKRIEAIMSRRATLPLNLAHKTILSIAAAATIAVPLAIGVLNAPAQVAGATASGPKPKFEIASVKPCRPDQGVTPGRKSGRGGGSFTLSPGRLHTDCASPYNLIRDAYLAYPEGKPWATATPADPTSANVLPGRGCVGCGNGLSPVSSRVFNQSIKGASSWVDDDRYTIDAKAENPAPPEIMRGPMMQSLLEDRFQLKIHREYKEQPVYELTLAAGAHLPPYQEGSCTPFDRFNPSTFTPGSGQPAPHVCGGFAPAQKGGTDIFGTTIAMLCRNLSSMGDRDVVDKTGLTGMFDLHLDTQPVAPSDDPDPGTPHPPTDADRQARFDMIQRALSKLGLKLQSAKGSAPYLVIDSIERPSGN